MFAKTKFHVGEDEIFSCWRRRNFMLAKMFVNSGISCLWNSLIAHVVGKICNMMAALLYTSFVVHICFSVLPFSASLPDYIIPEGINNNWEMLIEHYFNLGLNYSEILSFLVAVHGIHICLRQLMSLPGIFLWWMRGTPDIASKKPKESTTENKTWLHIFNPRWSNT